MAIMASESAFSQINSGRQSRHAPCGMSVDMSGTLPTEIIRTTTSRSENRGHTDKIAIRAAGQWRNQSGFPDLRKHTFQRAFGGDLPSHQTVPGDGGSPGNRRGRFRQYDTSGS